MSYKQDFGLQFGNHSDIIRKSVVNESICRRKGVSMAEQPCNIIVSGRLELKRGEVYHSKLEWYDEHNKRQRTSLTTGISIRGLTKNKDRERAYREAGYRLDEAIAKQQELLRRQQVTQPGSPSFVEDLLFADFMLMWLESINPENVPKGKKKIRPNTFGGYQMNVEATISPWFREKGILLSELAAEHINEFYDVQLERVKATSVHKYHANISKALKFAAKKGYIRSSEFILANVDKPDPEEFRGQFLQQSEAMTLIDAAKGDKLELAVILGVTYGLRREEIVGLRWKSINFEANTMLIEHTVTVANVDGKNVIVASDTTKTKSSRRTLPMEPVLRAKLLAMKAEQELNRKLCGKSYNKDDSDYIYVDVLGNLIKPNYITGAFPQFLERCSFRKIRFHDLRHTCASLFLANGKSLKFIQMWLGHSSLKTTADIYAHLDFSDLLVMKDALAWVENTALAQELLGDEKEKSQ